MKNWTLFLLITFMASAFANPIPLPGPFTLSASWLYFQPQIDQTAFALINPVGGGGSGIPNDIKPFINKPGFTSGLHIEGIYNFWRPFFDFQAEWSYLTNTSTANAVAKANEGIEITSIYLGPGTTFFRTADSISSKLQYHWNRAAALLRYHFYEYRRLGISIEGGLHYVNLSTRQNLNYFPAGGLAHVLEERESKTWGIGPQMGASLFYDIFQFLALKLHGEGALLIGEHSFMASSFLPAIPQNFNFDTETRWRGIPYTSFRLGLTSFFSSSRWAVDAEIGYEFAFYGQALFSCVFPHPNSGPPISLTDVFDSVIFAGPYLRLSITF